VAVSWDPTGRYLAQAQQSLADLSAPAPLDIWALSPQHDKATLAVQVTGLPSLADVYWSPDGQWLEIGTSGPVGYGYLIPLQHLLPALPFYAQPAVHTTLTLASAGIRNAPYGAAWRPGSSSKTPSQLTLLLQPGILQVQTPATGVTQEVTNLGWPPDNTYSSVCAQTWTADGRYFVLALCDTNFPEFVGLPAKIFVYDSLAT
jgi:hypothetical protein